MAVSQLAPLLHHVRRVAQPADLGGPTDGQLLDQYRHTRGEEAFAALVRRHGPMVFGVCRRVLGSVPDAEDAFQATFLLLVRNASRIAKCDSVGSWLHGVAYRTALKARSAARRRRIVERCAPMAATVEDEPAFLWRELRPVLDEEIGRLPERHRLPLVLCYLEGKTNAEAARLLRWPKGTVATRLARARQQLRERLTRRGAVLAAGGLCVLVPAVLRAAVVRVAVGKEALTGVVSGQAVLLAKGVLRTMSVTKLQLAAAVLLAVGAVGGVGGWFACRPGPTTAATGLAEEAELSPAATRGTVEANENCVYHLRNVAAVDVANAVNTSLGEQDPEQKGRISVVPEPITNKLLITAPPRKLAEIYRLVKELDADPPQVMLQAVVREVGADGHEELLSRPQFVTLDNQTAHFFVGQEGDSVELQLTPRIQPDGKILLRVATSITRPEPSNDEAEHVGWGTPVDIFTQETTVTAADGETVTLPGMKIRPGVAVSEHTVPLLGDLPLLGQLFHYRTTMPQAREVRVQLTLHVVRTRAEADRILAAETDKVDQPAAPKPVPSPR